jgi:hypothetical protein
MHGFLYPYATRFDNKSGISHRHCMTFILLIPIRSELYKAPIILVVKWVGGMHYLMSLNMALRKQKINV